MARDEAIPRVCFSGLAAVSLPEPRCPLSRLVLASPKDRASAQLIPPAAGAATLTTLLFETCVRVRTGILSAGVAGAMQPSSMVSPRCAQRFPRQAGVSFGAVHTLGMLQASSSVVEAGGADRARWRELRCWIGMAHRRVAGPTVSAQAPGVLLCGRLPATNMRKALVTLSAISTIEMMRSRFSPAGVSCLGGG